MPPRDNKAKDTASRRRRRLPKEAEAEIIAAAEACLAEQPFRDLEVEELMRRTTLKRSSFYMYFKDRNDLVINLIEGIAEEMFSAADRWLAGSSDPVIDIYNALEGVASVYKRHGAVLMAIAEASHHNSEVEQAYRWGLLERFIQAVAKRLRAEIRAGRAVLKNPEATAHALLLMNERYLVETLGRNPDQRIAPVVRTLQQIWVRTIYAADSAPAA
jgi:AcrR family transcriptional regulator